MSDITVQLNCNEWRDLVPEIESVAARAARACLDEADGSRFAAYDLTLALADAARVRQLNRDYRDQDKPTNVLSFSAVQHVPGSRALLSPPLYLGDVILSRETLVEEARAQGKNLTDHLSHLVVHGVLHLLGYDHDTDQKAEKMEALEIQILESLGIADPYAFDDGAPDAQQPRGGASGARQHG